MQNQIAKYQVQNPLLRKYIKFFWESCASNASLNHTIIPTRNINLRFNLSDTPVYICNSIEETKMENVFFSGLQDRFMGTKFQLNGRTHIFGICFYPEGFFPFVNVPVSEYKNQYLGAAEAGLSSFDSIPELLRNISNPAQRLKSLEQELLNILCIDCNGFDKLFNTLKQSNFSIPINDFCKSNNINQRKLERLFNKYVGISARAFSTIYRFQNGMNQLLYEKDFVKLSDIAYDNGYFDQTHYYRDFRRFTGSTPKAFVQQEKSLLQIAKFA